MRCQLFRADVASRLGDRDGTRSDRSTMRPRGFCTPARLSICVSITWCGLASRCEPRIFAAAQTAVEEGLHLARRCGLGLYHIELLAVSAELACMSRSQPPQSRRPARRLGWLLPRMPIPMGSRGGRPASGAGAVAQDRLVEGMAELEEGTVSAGCSSRILVSSKRTGCWPRLRQPGGGLNRRHVEIST